MIMSELEDFEQDKEPFVPAPLGPLGLNPTEDQLREQEVWDREYPVADKLHEEWQKRHDERKRILQDMVERQRAGEKIATEWTEWHTPSKWEKIWHCSGRNYRKRRKEIEDKEGEETVEQHPTSGYKRVRFLVAVLKKYGLPTTSG